MCLCVLSVNLCALAASIWRLHGVSDIVPLARVSDDGTVSSTLADLVMYVLNHNFSADNFASFKFTVLNVLRARAAFLLDHSKAYSMAFLAGQIEYWLEFFLFPSIKHHSYLTWLGIFMCLFGQFFRTGAMINAASNFTHLVATEKLSQHQLVVTGFYSYVSLFIYKFRI